MQDRFEYLKEHFLPRFWDSDGGGMILPELENGEITYVYWESQIDDWACCGYTLEDLLSNPRFIPMKPCGGLKDKRGTLMYEKDTVNYGGAKDLTIEWFDGGFHFVQYSGLTRPKTQPLSESNLSTVEIIGNIHQKGAVMNKDVKTYWVIKTVFRWVAVIFHAALVLPLILWFKYMLPANGVVMDVKIFALACLLSMYFAGFLLSIILSFSKPARETKEAQQ